mgnify:CR=1 FL=1
MTAFERAITSLLREEGGYVNDPRDPGGETNFGISRRSYPDLDLRALTEQEAVAIYRRDFWTPIRGEALPPALAIGLLDAAVNQGPVPAVLDLQRALDVPADGILGPLTLAAAARADAADILTRFFGRRALRYALARQVSLFGLGWFTRCFRVYRACLSAENR